MSDCIQCHGQRGLHTQGCVRRAREVALARFEKGDRVALKGWVGTYDAHPSDTFTAWCTFDGIGQYGADPRDLTRAKQELPL